MEEQLLIIKLHQNQVGPVVPVGLVYNGKFVGDLKWNTVRDTTSCLYFIAKNVSF